ncbi:MAG TPA: enoyl-CoA hydratase-related protein [Propionibacteriaceae bacterium]
MVDSGVRLDVTDQVGTITLDRPAALNALDVGAKEALLDAVRELGADPRVRCVVLTGTGRAFCVGQDLKEHIELLDSGTPDEVWRTVPEHYNPLALALHGLEKPVVAAVNGVAAGAGASLAFLADYRLVAASAGFNLAFAGIALSCDTGSSWTLPRLVGPTRAMDLLLNPRTITADEALRIGIATEVVPDGEFAARVATLSRTLAQGPTLAYAAIRTSVAYAASNTLAAALEVEAEMMAATGASDDHRRAVAAFVAKEKPTFTGT